MTTLSPVQYPLDLSSITAFVGKSLAYTAIYTTVGEFAKTFFPDLSDSNRHIAQAVITFGVGLFFKHHLNKIVMIMGISSLSLYVLSKLGFIGQQSQQNLKPPPDFLVNLNEEAKVDSLEYGGYERRLEQLEEAVDSIECSNCLMVANTGAGKTALIKALAKRIVEGEIPPTSPFYGKTIYSLDVIALLAGAKYFGTLEKRISKLVTYLKSRKDMVLFIDEMHVIFQSGNHSENNHANIAERLKPHIEQGCMIIGGTTPHDLGTIPRDTAFGRRFNNITLFTPTNPECVTMLQRYMGSKKFKEAYPQFSLDPKVLSTIVRLTNHTINSSDPSAVVQPSVAIKFLVHLAVKNHRKLIPMNVQNIAELFCAQCCQNPDPRLVQYLVTAMNEDISQSQ